MFTGFFCVYSLFALFLLNPVKWSNMALQNKHNYKHKTNTRQKQTHYKHNLRGAVKFLAGNGFNVSFGNFAPLRSFAPMVVSTSFDGLGGRGGGRGAGRVEVLPAVRSPYPFLMKWSPKKLSRSLNAFGSLQLFC